MYKSEVKKKQEIVDGQKFINTINLTNKEVVPTSNK